MFPDRCRSLVALAKGDRAALREALSRTSREELSRFFWTYEQAIAELERAPLLDHAHTLTEDEFRDLSSWIVGQGREAFVEALTDPSKLPREARGGWFVLTDITSEHERRFGEPLPPFDQEDYLMR
jgi:hypothetical protein